VVASPNGVTTGEWQKQVSRYVKAKEEKKECLYEEICAHEAGGGGKGRGAAGVGNM
jgi:hypothetical protein